MALSKLHALAEQHDAQIKQAVTERFPDDSADDLTPLTDKEDGVYISKEDSSAFCCLVVGSKSKHLFLVTALIDKEHKNLEFFRSSVIS